MIDGKEEAEQKNIEELAPVNPSGIEIGEEITLEEIKPFFKSFYRTRPYVSIIGGLCTQGKTKGDIDIFINSNHRDITTEFRIIRMFPGKYWFRFRFHYPLEEKEIVPEFATNSMGDEKTHPGKFTNYMDIFNEKIEVISKPELVLMSAAKKVELFTFGFDLLKPTTGKYEKGEEYTIDNLIKVVNAHWDYSKKIAVQRKYDGWHCRVDHSKEGKVKIYTEEGNEITNKLPSIVSELKEICKGHGVILTGELESWEKGKHNPRQKLTSILRSKGIHDDQETLKLNIFDSIFYDSDIHNEHYSVRLKSLNKLQDSEHIKKAETRIVDNEEDLRKAVAYFSAQEGAEGAYLKVFTFPYLLTGQTSENLKFKSTFSVDCKVIDIHKVKDADAWNYLCVIEDEKGNEVPIGRTYNTSIKVSEGDILKVEFGNLNQYETEEGKVWFSWWSPHVIMAREDKTKPDNTSTAEKLVVASKGSVTEKPYPKRYEDSILSVDWKQPYAPSKSNNKQLADDWRLFVAAIANLDAGKDEPFSFKDIYIWATACLKEITKRVKAGSMKFSISKEKSAAYRKLWKNVSKKVEHKFADTVDGPGLYLVAPHAEFIASGIKTLIVKSRNFLQQCDKELILCSSGLCFGTLKMRPPRKATRAELDELQLSHHITPEEIKKWWSDVKEFYLYDIYDLDVWKRPRHADIPQGVQTFIKKVKLTDAGGEEEDAVDPYMVYPDESKKYKGMCHSHIRGRSVHLDLRLQISEKYMLGWTLYIPEGLSKDPETFAEAKALNEKEIMPIVRKTMSNSSKKFNCGPKEELPPIEWSEYEGTAQPGEIGATKKEHGHFIIIDSFNVQFGAKKSYFHEIFCDGKIFNGRIIFRQLKNKKEWKRTDQGEVLTWFCFNALQSPTPYVLSTRAVKKKWIAPYGSSALPRNLRSKIPEKYRYWKKKDEKTRLECRAELVVEINKKLVKLDERWKNKLNGWYI